MSATPLDAIQSYIDAFNAGDADGMSAMFSVNGSILDGMAPHQWLGPTAVADWYRDVMAESEHLGASDYHVAAGEPPQDSSLAATYRKLDQAGGLDGAAVADALETGGLGAGRQAVAQIVGRDPERLDEAAVCRAASGTRAPAI